MTRPTNMFSFKEGRLRTSPMPPPFLSPWFRVVTMHIIRVSQARSLTLSSASASELVWVSEKDPSQFLSSALHVFGGVDAEKEDNRKITGILKEIGKNNPAFQNISAHKYFSGKATYQGYTKGTTVLWHNIYIQNWYINKNVELKTTVLFLRIRS